MKVINFKDDSHFVKLGEINSIFSDIIQLSYNKENGVYLPFKREAKRIARYFPTNIQEGFKQELDLVIKNYISRLAITSCDSVKVFNNESNFINTANLIMQFDCTFFHEANDGIPSQTYIKRIMKDSD